MKHKTTILIMLVILSLAFETHAAPKLVLGSATGQPGSTAVLNLSLSGGTQNYAGVNAKIQLPKGITMNDVSKGALLESGFTTDWHSFSDAQGNIATVIAYSGTARRD